ncbi:hypothetical protein E2C01_003352 [Portunus trituberculatus]|uniref:Uncharacterized protein n=1 Tax=Portunus trituberculatus TaxID=210409 RepID=A0A5B7CLZ0_PORTR|nr:hypothetical protein [Portunus trituberculatus]
MHRSSGRWVAYCLNAILSGRPRQPCVMPLTLVPAHPSPAASVPGDGPPCWERDSWFRVRRFSIIYICLFGDVSSMVAVLLPAESPAESGAAETRESERQLPVVVTKMAAGVRENEGNLLIKRMKRLCHPVHVLRLRRWQRRRRCRRGKASQRRISHRPPLSVGLLWSSQRRDRWSEADVEQIFAFEGKEREGRVREDGRPISQRLVLHQDEAARQGSGRIKISPRPHNGAIFHPHIATPQGSFAFGIQLDGGRSGHDTEGVWECGTSSGKISWDALPLPSSSDTRTDDSS